MKITPIRLRRLNAGIGQLEAIKSLDIAQSTFYKLEQGHFKPSASLISKISKLYDCSIDELYKDLKIN
ncbi:MAG: helix-turn-helix transcriptional regulator [Clostridium sp.]